MSQWKLGTVGDEPFGLPTAMAVLNVAAKMLAKS